MSWTTPTVRATGYLVTASDWNTDIVDNLAYLKGEAGEDIAFEDDVVPSAGTEKVGLSTNPWDEGHYDKLFAGPRYSIHRFVREVLLTWPNKDIGEDQVESHESVANSSIGADGTGQIVLTSVDNASAYIYVQTEAETNGQDNSFNASRSPYYRQEFAVSQNVSDAGIFIGLRQTPGDSLPDYSAEHFFGFVWTGAIWIFQTGNASAQDVSGTQTITANKRYVVEFLLTSTVSVECYLNGVLIDTLTVVPTGDLEWSVLLETDGGGGATETHLTLGMGIIQEDLQ